MSKILTKPYKRLPVGTALTSDQDEFTKAVLGVPKKPPPERKATVYVNAERIAQLEREGYFDAPPPRLLGVPYAIHEPHWTEITRDCGHVETVALYGPEDQRREMAADLAKHPCRKCYSSAGAPP